MLPSALIAALSALPNIVGGLECPTDEQVAQALAPLLTPAERDSGRSVHYVQDESGIHLTLSDEVLGILAEKLLPAEGDCEDMAQAIAVVIASWEVQARDLAAIPLPPPPVRPSPQVMAVTTPPRQSTSRPSALDLTLAAGVLGAYDGRDLAPSLQFDIAARRAEGPWLARVALGATGVHTVPLGPGAVAYRRLVLECGVGWQRALGAVRIDLGLAGASSVLLLEGREFTTNRQVTSWDVGLKSRVRAGLARRRMGPWLEVGVATWGRQQDLVIQGLGRLDQIGRWELLVGAGMGFDLGR